MNDNAPLSFKSAMLAVLCVAATGLVSCDRQSGSGAGAPAAPSGNAVQGERKLLAEWRSFSFNPPRYATEVLRVYNDLSCVVETAKDRTTQPCQWRRLPQDQILIAFPKTGREITAALKAGQGTTGSASYLTIELPNKLQQTFVLAGSPDDAMVVNAVKGDLAWGRRDYNAAIDHYTNAANQGSPYAKLRLGWIFATHQGYLRPALALQLLTPMANLSTYSAQSALAAAYAANGKSSEAVAAAESACRFAQGAQQDECAKRLEVYRSGKSLLIDLSATVAAAAPAPEAAPAPTPVAPAPVAPVAPAPAPVLRESNHEKGTPASAPTRAPASTHR